MGSLQTISEDAVAVVGLACRFPGAPDAHAFWRGLEAGREGVRRFEVEELAEAGVPEELLARPDYVRARAVLEDAECFDAPLFGLTDHEASLLDPQHRVFLECSWAACEDAGLDPARFDGSVALYAGASPSRYALEAARRSGADGFAAGMGTTDFLATRVAWALGLEGPALSVQTACSTSLVAVHLACQALLNGECDAALAGGVSVKLPLVSGYLHQEGGVLAPDGRCRAFDARAAGTVPGSGVGVVVLRRLEDALEDGDPVRAVIRGTAVNNDGRAKVGYTAPSVEGQARVIAEALDVGRVPPESVSYVEAHGTATEVGDPIEVEALRRVLEGGGESGVPAGRCALGSVKTNIGHVDAAAGIAGLIKTVLALERRRLPPSLHFETANPRIDFGPRLRVQAEAADWPQSEHPRRAGVSSFGIGGTNAHAVLEEAPPRPGTAPGSPWRMVRLSAHTPEALARVAERLADRLAGLSPEEGSLADVAHTLHVGRRALRYRRGVVARDLDDAVAVLGERIEPERTGRSGPAPERPPPVVFLFPGQGAPLPGVGRELYRSEPAFAAAVDEGLEVLGDDPGREVQDLLLAAGETVSGRRAGVAQPALFLLEIALARVWAARGVEPAALLGHSLGEYAAACLAGVFPLATALSLVADRGRAFEGLAGGAMTAVHRSEDEVLPWLGGGLSLAAINAPDRCVVSGPTAEVEALEERWRREGIASRRLEASHAFHSAMVEPLLPAFRERVVRAEPSLPRRRWISTLTGREPTGDDARDPEHWSRQTREPVRFATAVAGLLEERPVFLEVGPGAALTQSVRSLLRRAGTDGAAVASLGASGRGRPAPAVLLDAAARLWEAGVAVEESDDGRRRRLSLPAYPFDRRRFAPDPAAETSAEAVAGTGPAAPRADPAEAGAGGERRDRVGAELRSVLAELVGMPADEIAATADLLDLGMDSLLVMQLSQRIEVRFGARVPFRELLGGLSRLEDLTSHLERTATREPGAEPPSGVPGTSPGGETEEEAEAETFGPYRSLRARARGGPELDPGRRAHLDALTDRYAARTAGSKEAAARHRPHLADSRASASFRREWKEMVYPVVAASSAGSKVRDVDGNVYVDFTMGFGVHLFGHSPRFVLEALARQMEEGLHIGPQTELAGDVARRIHAFTGLDRVGFCNTGTEAVMAALRIARAVTGRSGVAMFAGSFHGTSDGVLARPRGDGRPEPLPVAPGVPRAILDGLSIHEYGAPEALEAIRRRAGTLAAVLVEPIQSRRPDVFPRRFLEELRELTREHGVALIFDEVITGFRVHPAGAQGLLGWRADLATYGKVLGAGLPIGVVAGSARFMDAVDGGPWRYGDDSAPSAVQTVFAGTFSKNPASLAVARAVLEELERRGPQLQDDLNRRTADLARRLDAALAARGAALSVAQGGSLFRFVPRHDDPASELLFFHLLERGVYIWEGRGCFLSTAHTGEDEDHLVTALEESLDALAGGGFLAPAEPESRPLTPSQLHLWVHANLDRGASLAYNELLVFRLRGAVDPEALERVIRGLVRRHEALRITFSPEGDRQRLHADMPVALERSAGPPPAGGVDAWLGRELERPFDLERGPLLRAALRSLEPDEQLFVLAVHHLAADGFSMGILAREIPAAYAAAVEGREPDLPPPASYRRWLDRRLALEPEEAARIRERWREAARGALPLDPGIEPASGEDRGRPAGRVTGSLKEVEGGAAALANATGSTLPAVLTGAFLFLIHRLYDQDDLLIGMPWLGRAFDGDEGVVGHCVDILPLRSRASGDPPFRDFLARTRRTMLDAQEGAVLAAELWTDAGSGTAERALAIGVVFNVEGVSPRGTAAHWPREPVGGVLFEPRVPPPGHAKFGVVFDVTGGPDGLRVSCTYDEEICDRPWIEALVERYRMVLGEVAGRPEVRLSALPLLTDTEARALAAWNDTDRELAFDLPVHRRFAARAESEPDVTAVVFEGDHLSYGELRRRAWRLARLLRAAGSGPGDLVGLCMNRSAELVVALLAVVEVGGAHVPLEPDNPPDRIAAMIADARIRRVVTRTESAALLDGTGIHRVLLDAPHGEPPVAAPAPPYPDPPGSALAYALFTSGSTGRPKGVAVTHRAVTNQVLWMDAEIPLESTDRVLQMTPLSFDVSVYEVYWPLCFGARVVVARPGGHRDPAYIARTVAREGITTCHFVPSLLKTFLDEEELGARCRSLRRVICSGEALPPDVRDDFLGRLDADLYNFYGPSETGIDVTYHRCAPGAGRPMSLGVPGANTRIHVLDRRGRRLPPGVAGELFVGGIQLSPGYLHDPARTADRFGPDPFSGGAGSRLYRTGDRGRWTRTGQLEYHGRLDQQLKIRGQRVEPGEIEAVLRSSPGLRDAAVVARDLGTERGHLVAYVVPAAGAVAPSESELRAFAAESLPEHMVPSFWMTLPELPLNANGKLDRRALPEAGRGGGRPSVPPETAVQERVWAVWCEILGHELAGIDDNFFEVGGNSLLIIRVARRLAANGAALDVTDLFAHPTVRGQAARLSGGAEEAAGTSEGRAADLAAGADRLARLRIGARAGDPRESGGA